MGLDIPPLYLTTLTSRAARLTTARGPSHKWRAGLKTQTPRVCCGQQRRGATPSGLLLPPHGDKILYLQMTLQARYLQKPKKILMPKLMCQGTILSAVFFSPPDLATRLGPGNLRSA
jgi:hypothetical protein